MCQHNSTRPRLKPHTQNKRNKKKSKCYSNYFNNPVLHEHHFLYEMHFKVMWFEYLLLKRLFRVLYDQLSCCARWIYVQLIAGLYTILKTATNYSNRASFSRKNHSFLLVLVIVVEIIFLTLINVIERENRSEIWYFTARFFF